MLSIQNIPNLGAFSSKNNENFPKLFRICRSCPGVAGVVVRAGVAGVVVRAGVAGVVVRAGVAGVVGLIINSITVI
ncbi:MAG: hypothetical protein WC117_09405 [Sphaerochaetaceae bacterium]